MRCYGYVTLIILLSFFGFDKIKGQTSSYSPSVSIKYALEYFQNNIGADSHLYTGKGYTWYNKSGIKGHPFFISGQMQSSEVLYDGTLY